MQATNRSPLARIMFLWIIAIATGTLQTAAAAAVGTSVFMPTTVTLSQCIAYNASTAAAAGSVTQSDGSAVLSTLLVGDEVGPPVGAVEVRDLTLKHSNLGALMISLHWLPYEEKAPNMNPRELEEVANETVILKDTRQGGSGSDIASVAFTDATDATIPTTSTSNVNGTFKPYTPLTAFSAAQLPSRGRWVLAVEDTGSNRKTRTLQLLHWSLVLCPRSNTTLPPDLVHTMVQGAGLDLSAALGGGGLFASALHGAGDGGGVGGLFKAAFHHDGSRTLLPAVGTLVTVQATTEYKTYSDLADQAVNRVVGAVNNIQTLFGLPYQPSPLIDKWLPWVKLLIGGTDLTLQNKVWPGKIVYYALQLEVFVRTRETMAAPGNTTGGGAGNSTAGSGGSGGGNSTSLSVRATQERETPNCGVVDGPYGPQVVNKKLLQREMCRWMMPVEFSQYAEPGAMDAQSPSGTTATTTGSAATASTPATDVNLRSSSNLNSSPKSSSPFADNDIIELPARPDAGPADARGGMFPIGQQPQRRLQNWAQSQGLALGTDLTPMSFLPGPAFEAAGGTVSMPQEAQEALEMLPELPEPPGQQQEAFRDGGALPPLFDGMVPDPEAVSRIMRNSFKDLDTASFHQAMEKQLDLAVERSQNASDLLDRAQKHPELKRRGGHNATKAAEALKAGVDTQKEVLKAARDMVKRFSQKELRDQIDKWIKDGGWKKEMEGQRNASKSNAAQYNRFIFNFQRVRLTFRFSAEDGFQFSYIQWIYDLSDVLNIITAARALQTLDDAQSGGKSKRSRIRNDAQNATQLDDKHKNQTEHNHFNNGQRRQRGRMSTGETPEEFMARVTGQARATAKRALSRIPLSSTVGPGRMPTTGNLWGG